MRLKDFAPYSWPIVAMVILVSFYGPIYRTLDALSESLKEVARIKIGDLEIALDADELPRPDAEVVTALRGVSKEGLLLILELTPPTRDESSSGGYCFHDLETDSRMKQFRELEAAGLVSIEAQEEENDWCPNPHSVQLTSVGVAVRDFSASLLVAQFSE